MPMVLWHVLTRLGLEYNTFDERFVADAKNGETVTLLADAETAGLDLSKNLTIDGGGNALKFTDKGIALRARRR